MSFAINTINALNGGSKGDKAMKTLLISLLALVFTLSGVAWGETDMECYKKWRANSPDYPIAIGNITAEEFSNLVDKWCANNPPEKEKTIRFIPGYPQNIIVVEPDEILIYSGKKPKPCRWEVDSIATNDINAWLKEHPGWEPFAYQPPGPIPEKEKPGGWIRLYPKFWLCREVCE